MEEKTPLFVFDEKDNLLAVTDQYDEALFEETVDFPVSLIITYPMADEKAKYFVGGNQVAFKDLKGNFRLFVIRELDDVDGEMTEKIITCFPAITQDLDETVIEDRRPQNATIDEVLDVLLEKTKWQRGNTVDLGRNSTNFYYETAKEGLTKKVKSIWGGEYIDRIEIKDGRIAGRYLDVVYSKGENKGKRFEIGKDIEQISRTVLHYPKTALYGRGSSLPTGDGYGRKISFADVEWKKSNGDPVDKPLGQEWVGDDEARKELGVYNPKTKQMEHRFGIFEDPEEQDPAKLLEKTWNAVQKYKQPQVQYSMSISTFYGLSDYEHEQVFVGDTGIARDKNVSPMILVQARVTSLTYDLADISKGEVVIGNFLELNEDEEEINWAINKLKNNAGIWDSSSQITDESFPDIKPPTPTNFKAENGFARISLLWDFDASAYISAYELHGSKTKSFTPSETTLIWKGKSGGFVHTLSVNEQWYYRLRAVNTHGTPSDWTEEISAKTLQINAETEIEEKTITEKLLAAEAIIDSIHIHEGAITNAHIRNLRWDKAQGGTATLGGGGNGNGVLNILNANNELMVQINNTGITLDNGARLIGNGGVLSTFVFTSSGRWSGWQDIGNTGVGYAGRYKASLFAHIPDNFIITKAILTTYSAPLRDIQNNRYHHAPNMRLYKTNTYNGARLNAEFDVWFDYTTSGTDISSAVWGGAWTPSNTSSVQSKVADVTSHVRSGPNTFYVNTSSTQRGGILLMVLMITGYQQ